MQSTPISIILQDSTTVKTASIENSATLQIKYAHTLEICSYAEKLSRENRTNYNRKMKS